VKYLLRNEELHRDLGINYVSEEIRKFVRSHEERQHEDIEAIRLLDKTNQRKLFFLISFYFQYTGVPVLAPQRKLTNVADNLDPKKMQTKL
jgi:hypothetical protein